jgi:hypothetical protein
VIAQSRSSLGLGRWLLPPLAAFAGALVITLLVAVAAGFHPLAAATWSRFDSNFYLMIASSGYHLLPCQVPGQAHAWCGNPGWFPGYPAVLAPLFDLGLPHKGTAVVISLLFLLATLTLLWNGFLRDLGDRRASLALAFAACGPGTIYTHAVFPMAMAAFFIVACLALVRSGRVLAAAVPAAAAAASYPTGILLAPLLGGWALVAAEGASTRRRVSVALSAAGLAMSGLIAVLLVMEVGTGKWNAYFLVQANYHHTLSLPFLNLWSTLSPIAGGSRRGSETIPAVEAAFVIAVVVAISWGCLRSSRRHQLRAFDWFILLTVFVFWLAPLSQSHVNYYRGDSLLVPASLLVPRLPTRIAIVLCAGAIATFALTTYGFFNQSLM